MRKNFYTFEQWEQLPDIKKSGLSELAISKFCLQKKKHTWIDTNTWQNGM